MGDTHGVTPRRGDVFLVNFDPTIGAEIQKTRPAIILQNDIANRYSPVTIVAAISSAGAGKIYPTEVAIGPGVGGLDRSSIVLLNQVRTIDKQRLVRKIGSLDRGTMERVDAALVISFGLTDI
jgi:mRNA interferase MazF